MISDFYLFLKLGLWKTGIVSGWGKIDLFPNSEADDYLLKKSREYYLDPLLPKRVLGTGICLLDFYLSDNTSGQSKTYIVVLSIAPSGLENKERLCFLKMTSHGNVSATTPEELQNESITYYRKKRRTGGTRRIDTSPLNSYQRKY